MLAALIIVFREVLEAGIIVGIMLAVTRGIAHRGWWIGGGVAVGALGACVAAVFAGALAAAFEGYGQEFFNAAILIVAVVMLTWHNVWMAHHGRELAAEMRAAGEAVAAGAKSLAGLSVVVAVAVLREGFEAVLFLYGVVAASDPGSGFALFAGGAIGLLLGAAISAMTYLGLLTIPSRYLFQVTTIMLAFLAAGMAAQAVAFLEDANALTALGAVLWDSSWLLSDHSMVGRALHTLVGYSDRPTGLQFLVYLATLAATFGLLRLFSSQPAPQAQAG
jgi:high-affinity iron transporter